MLVLKRINLHWYKRCNIDSTELVGELLIEGLFVRKHCANIKLIRIYQLVKSAFSLHSIYFFLDFGFVPLKFQVQFIKYLRKKIRFYSFLPLVFFNLSLFLIKLLLNFF